MLIISKDMEVTIDDVKEYYDALRWGVKSLVSTFVMETDVALEKILKNELGGDIGLKRKEHALKVHFTQEFLELHKDFIATFKKVWQAYRTEDLLSIENQNDSTTTEDREKSSEFAPNLFRISTKGWEPTEFTLRGQWPVSVLINDERDVIEFQWQQIFLTFEALLREVAKEKNCTPEVAEVKYLIPRPEFDKLMIQKIADRTYPALYQMLMLHTAPRYIVHDTELIPFGDNLYIFLAGNAIGCLGKESASCLPPTNRPYGASALLRNN